MQYLHRTPIQPDVVMDLVVSHFGSRLAPEIEDARRRCYSGALGRVTISAVPEGGHYTLVTVITDQLAESELDKLAKRFLGEVHVLAHPHHALRGAY